jgi:MFS transporter, PPP family, 3-phenylpropionic acid transporter
LNAESPPPSIFATPAARVTMIMSALFGTTGVILVFLPRWLEVERGLSGAEIGVILSLAQFARTLTGPLIAYRADRASDRAAPIKLIALATVLAYTAFFFLASGFWQLLALGFVAISLQQSMTPLIEAAVLRATAKGKLSYGVARGIGSLAFIAANVLGGIVIARFGLVAVVVWVLCGLAITAATGWFGLQRDPPPVRTTSSRTGGANALLRNRKFLILIVACGLIQAAHGFYYSFSTIVWRGQGISPEMVGVLWAFGVAVEVAFLWSLPIIERRSTPEALILIGAGAAVARWFAMGFAPLGWVLWPLQALHALSFAAAHVGAMRLLQRETPEHSAAMAQTLYAVMSGGLLMGASTLLSGHLYDVGGAIGYWAMAVMAAAGGALALLLLSPKTRVPEATPR